MKGICTYMSSRINKVKEIRLMNGVSSRETKVRLRFWPDPTVSTAVACRVVTVERFDSASFSWVP